MMIVHTFVSLMHPATTQKVVYGAKSEVAAAAGLNGILPDVFIEYYQKSGIEMVDGCQLLLVEAKGMVPFPSFCCLWDVQI
jgi:hypothetical protein